MKRLLPLALLLAGCAAEDPSAGLQPVGSTAPDFKVETLSVPSSGASLSKRRGKVVLIDFWATWCGPCRQLSPTVEGLYRKYKAQGLEAMAISAEKRETVAAYEAERPHEMPVYLDSSREASTLLGVVALPTVLVIDRQGHVQYRFSGVPNSPDGMEEAIQTALKA